MKKFDLMGKKMELDARRQNTQQETFGQRVLKSIVAGIACIMFASLSSVYDLSPAIHYVIYGILFAAWLAFSIRFGVFKRV